MNKISLITVSIVFILIASSLYLFLYNPSKLIQADEKQTENAENSESVENLVEIENKKAREKVEKMSDEEVKMLLKRFDEANTGGPKLSQEEFDLVNAISQEEYLDLFGMTEKEILSAFDNSLSTVNTNIIFAYQDGIDSDEYNGTHRKSVKTYEPLFKWMRDNYNFDTEYSDQLIKDVIKLINSHVDGDNDAIFTLKYTLYELNEIHNPEALKEVKATSVSLSDTEKIRNGEEPTFDQGN